MQLKFYFENIVICKRKPIKSLAVGRLQFPLHYVIHDYANCLGAIGAKFSFVCPISSRQDIDRPVLFARFYSRDVRLASHVNDG